MIILFVFSFHRRLNEEHESVVVPSGNKIHSLAISSFEVSYGKNANIETDRSEITV